MLNEIKPITSDDLSNSFKTKVEIALDKLIKQATEEKDEQIIELKAQIEKMKCCENCKYHSYWGNEVHCDYGLKEALQEDILIECKDMDKWELAND